MVTLEQVGANVVATGSGAFSLTGLSLNSVGGGVTAAISPTLVQIVVASGNVDGYSGTSFSGPTSLGPAIGVFASSSSGAAVALTGHSRELFVPAGYVPGTLLSDTSTYNNATFASLGVTPGTYVWTWGAGGANQTFTLEIGGSG
jgi:hypothetical protein